MKAIVCPEYGPVSNLEYRDLPDPQPGPNEVVIKAEAIGVNYPVCPGHGGWWHRRGGR